jgi:DNA-binding NarL/FixJ family response regulator
LIAEEETTKGIALRLHLSPKTVEFHRAQLMRRLNIYNQIGLAKVAIRLGMVTL